MRSGPSAASASATAGAGIEGLRQQARPAPFQSAEAVKRAKKPIAQTIPEQYLVLVMCSDELQQLALVRMANDEGPFDFLPILADALEEEGCADQIILDPSGGRGCMPALAGQLTACSPRSNITEQG